MVTCPKCKTELDPDASQCNVCGAKVVVPDIEWVLIGGIADKISADFAKETLTSSSIQAVVFSRSGFFGTVGLPLNPIYSSGFAMFEVLVLSDDREEAVELLEMTLGDKFAPVEE